MTTPVLTALKEAPAMSTTETEAAPLTNCPSCGSHVLSTVTLDYGATAGYRPDALGVTPEQGDTITRCDDCGNFYVHAEDGTVAGQQAPEPTPAADDANDTPPAQGDLAAVEAFVMSKLNELADVMGERVKELEDALSEREQELAGAIERANAAEARTPPDPPAEPAAPETPPAPVPDPPATT